MLNYIQGEDIESDKKHQATTQKKEDNKVQGVGSTIPESWKEKAAAKVAAKAKELEMANAEESLMLPWWRFKQRKLASHNGLFFKKLQLLDKTELQRMWDQGGKGKTGAKEKEKASAVAKPLNSKVQALGPAQKILALAPALSTAQCASAKRKCSSTSSSGKPNSSSKLGEHLTIDHGAALAGIQLIRQVKSGSDDNSNSRKEEGDSKALETEEEDVGNNNCKTKVCT
ncbi:hypothetical protein RHS01_09094 [Rhizoctonia solani]|uniref:Uncharacterized protein n=1 Tax=Rhizoctonia solani TaxID=456999 RepID=A0A8H7M1B7_9AGAM|nr:hypothetical protein RHS01_09094 [Rhizoctonia solani]